MPLLAHEIIRHSMHKASDKPTLLFLHGMLARRQNLRSFARLFVESMETDALLVDHRGHGDSHFHSSTLSHFSSTPTQSQQQQQLLTPTHHTVQSCVDDLKQLLPTLALAPVGTVIGHSFGGKVAVLFSDQQPSVEYCVTLDSPPGPWHDLDPNRDSVARLFSILPQLNVHSKAQIAHDLEFKFGFSNMVALWMTTNFKGEGRWVFDLVIAKSLFADYATLDLFPMLKNIATPHVYVEPQKHNAIPCLQKKC